jgi:hypothetical protein
MTLSAQTQARLAVVLTTVAAPLLFFHRATFSDKVFITRDILRVYYPLRQYWAERVSQLQFPDWYPYDALGQPYAGMLISGAFHPANLLYLVLSLGTALKVTTLLSYVAAVAGTYRFCRLWALGRTSALLAGLAFGLCGYMVCISNNLLYLMAAATLPWALGSAERFFRQRTPARAATAALLLCLVLLSGDSQSFAVCNTLVLVLALLRPDRAPAGRALLQAGLLVVLSALLCSVQLLPLVQVLREAIPGAPDLATAHLFSLHPLRLLELLVGPLFTHPEWGTVASRSVANDLLTSGMGDLWVNSIQLGAPVLLLGVLALIVHRRDPRTWLLAAGTLLLLGMALGHNLPFYGWVYQLVPPWRPFRFPEKLLPFVCFVCALAAGLGLERLREDALLRRRVAGAGLLLMLACGLLALAEWRLELFSRGMVSALWPAPEPDILPLLRGNFLQATLQTAVALGLFALVLTRVDRADLRAGLVVLLQLGVLYVGNQALYHVSFPELLERPTAFVEHILQKEGRGAAMPRVLAVYDEDPPLQPGMHFLDHDALTTAMALLPDTSALWGLESANRYLPGASRRYIALGRGFNPWVGRFAGLFNTRYITLSSTQYEKLGGNPDFIAASNPELRMVLLNNPRTLPRAYLADPLCVPDEAAASRMIGAKSFQPGRQVVLECPPGSAETASAPGPTLPGRVTLRQHAPERVELDEEADRAAVLVLNDAWYSGWSATLDGAPVTILPANLVVRGVHVPAGSHRVVFTYRTPGLLFGAILSLTTLGLLGVGMLLGRKRPKQTEPR